jgi:hypothetical protein
MQSSEIKPVSQRLSSRAKMPLSLKRATSLPSETGLKNSSKTSSLWSSISSEELQRKASTSPSIKPTTFLSKNTSSQKEDQGAQEISHKEEEITTEDQTPEDKTPDHQEEMMTDKSETTKTDQQEETMTGQPEITKIDQQEDLKVKTDQEELKDKKGQEELKDKKDQEELKDKKDQEEQRVKTDHKETIDQSETIEKTEATIETTDHPEEKTTTELTTETLIEEEKTTTTTDPQEDNNKDTNPEDKNSEKELQSNGPRLTKSVQLMTDLTSSSRYYFCDYLGYR